MNTPTITKQCIFPLLFCIVGCLERTRYELSDILYEKARVVSKKHETVAGVPIISVIGDMPLIIPTNDTETYELIFDGDNVDFTITEKDVYDQFTKGDEVVISYRETRQIITELDCITWKKRSQKISIAGYKFVGVRYSAEGMCKDEMCYK